MKIFDGIRRENDGNTIHPDYICNMCKRKITGGMIPLSSTSHFHVACYNMFKQAEKLTTGPLLKNQ